MTPAVLTIEVRRIRGKKQSPFPGFFKDAACGGHAFRIFIVLLLIFSALSVPIPTGAQIVPRLDPSGRSGEKPPDVLEEKLPPQLPTVPIPPPPAPPREGLEALFKTVFVRKVIVEGSTVFTPDEISKVTAPYENRQLATEDLEALRRDLTILYVNKGYVSSGAVIPDQTVADGVIRYQIIEGRLTQIDVAGNKWFADSYLRDRIALGAKPPVNISPLQDRLQLLQLDQRIRSIRAEMRPGERPGETVLKVYVEEKNPFYAQMAFNNYQSPSIGAERGLLTLAHQNLTGHGDIFNVTYGRSEGLRPEFDTWYMIPINAHDTTLLFHYRVNNFDVINDPFEPLGIHSQTSIFGLTLRQPVYRSLNQEFALALGIEYETNKTFLLGEPFPFYPGVEDDGEQTVIPLRFSQEWIYRTQRQVIAARSRFSFGLDVNGATINDSSTTPDGKFIAWLGQFQWARILELLDTQALFRIDYQKTDDPLLPLEQISVGGRYSVRGYRENLLVRDDAFITSLEFRVPVIQNKRWADYIQLCPFFDYGWAEYRDFPTPDPKYVYSTGIGLRWAAPIIKSPVELRAELEFYWGYALKHVDVPYDDIQDSGFHFQFALTGF
jgi:hemolysin activation/secretion protein